MAIKSDEDVQEEEEEKDDLGEDHLKHLRVKDANEDAQYFQRELRFQCGS